MNVYSIAETAQAFGVSEKSVKSWCDRGLVRYAKRIGRLWAIGYPFMVFRSVGHHQLYKVIYALVEKQGDITVRDLIAISPHISAATVRNSVSRMRKDKLLITTSRGPNNAVYLTTREQYVPPAEGAAPAVTKAAPAKPKRKPAPPPPPMPARMNFAELALFFAKDSTCSTT